MEKGQDIVLGLVFAAIGVAAAIMATAYSGAGGVYPMILGIVLALLGLAVTGRALVMAENVERPLVAAPKNLLIAVIIGVVYVALIVPLGFYTASALLMLAAPLALGFHRLVYTLVAAGVFITMVWVIFSLVLEKPLPREIWFTLGFGGAS